MIEFYKKMNVFSKNGKNEKISLYYMTNGHNINVIKKEIKENKKMKNMNEIKHDIERRHYTRHLERQTFKQSVEWIACLAIEDFKNKHH